MIRAVIFDCFGVLVRGSLETFHDRYFRDDPELLQQARDLDAATSSGMIPYDEFLRESAKLAGISVKQVQAILDDTPANERLLDYIRDELKPRYRIGMLSNAGDNWLDDLFSKDQQALFDDFVLSYRYKMSKPDERIYRIAAENLGVEPSECVFIDDIARYCDGARDVGMQVIQYEAFEQFQTDISAVLKT